ncbi:hypothetical protein C8F01DRAFT_1263421 [Mycena amicta]|nr:hypothetical protein C8F01DRAFT_1091913 [Mycena amicta]KAJ7050938.1 hypothetical protein C8F01DRAFT_1263421 [Mycena amicta]
MSESTATQKCSLCHIKQPATSDFYKVRASRLTTTCKSCLTRLNAKRKGEKKPNNENVPLDSYVDPDTDSDNDDKDYMGPSITKLEDFLAVIAFDENARSFGTFINTSTTGK